MRSWIFCSFLPVLSLAASQPYEVRFVGLDNRDVEQAVKNSSELIALKERPPASLNGLRYRIKQDIPRMIKTLHSFCYYDAEIMYDIAEGEQGAVVILSIHPGVRYRLSAYDLFHQDCTQVLGPICNHPIPVEQLGLTVGKPTDSAELIRAEKLLLIELGRCGYPLSYIDKRRVLVDVTKKEIAASVCVQEGPQARFGHTTLFGLKTVHPRFIEQKIAWEEGNVFDSDLITETEKRLLKSDLFNSVLVSHSDSLNDKGEITMNIRLSETKHHSFSVGVFYATVDGPGGTFSWSNRNLGGVGEQLKLISNASIRFIDGLISYRKPDLWKTNLTLSVLGSATREHIHPYLAFTYLASNRFEFVADPHKECSLGIKGDYTIVHQSANNGTFFLLGVPFFGKIQDSDSPLDPRKGYLFSYSATGYQSLQSASVHFFKQQIRGATYIPLDQDKKLSLALEVTIGSIAGADQKDIPIPKLFLGGSQDDLRGYTYKTVSPLDDRGKSLGGRSSIFATVELRARLSKTIGLVPFFDFGTVSLKEVPQLNETWYKSVGGGIRYYTFFGPLRIDVGFPLNRRKPIDTWGKVYASVGQTF